TTPTTTPASRSRLRSALEYPSRSASRRALAGRSRRGLALSAAVYLDVAIRSSGRPPLHQRRLAATGERTLPGAKAGLELPMGRPAPGPMFGSCAGKAAKPALDVGKGPEIWADLRRLSSGGRSRAHNASTSC